MIKVKVFKMPFRTNLYNKNQKVWVLQLSGNLSACVIGKRRGKYRYVSSWVSWDSKSKDNPKIKDIDVDVDFCKRHGLATQ